MQAIITKYLSPTNSRGSRIKATCDRGSIVIAYDHMLSEEQRHREAVNQLVAKFVAEDEGRHGFAADPKGNPWALPFVTGGLPSGECVHVFLSTPALQQAAWADGLESQQKDSMRAMADGKAVAR